MAKKRYAMVASFAAACMMLAGFGAGTANAAETVPAAKDAPATQQTSSNDATSTKQQAPSTDKTDAAQGEGTKVDVRPATGDQSKKADVKVQPQTQSVKPQQGAPKAIPLSNPVPSTQSVTLPDSVSISNVRVSDVGAHTANIAFDYNIKHTVEQTDSSTGETQSRYVDSYMPVIDFLYVSNMTPEATATQASAENDPGYYEGDDSSNSVSDDKLDASSYQRIYGWHSDDWYQFTTDYSKSVKVASNVRYKNFYRYYDTQKVTEDISGTQQMTLLGLDSSTSYGNRNVNANGKVLDKASNRNIVAAHAQELVAQGKAGQQVNTDIMMLRVGMQTSESSCTAFDGGAGCGSGSGEHFVDIPAFATKAEPQAPASGDLNNGNKGDVTAPSNPVAGSPSRIYINNLSAQCKADVDGENTPSCFWSGYIYSNPTQLTDRSGAPYLEVQKDEKGYYVEPLLPRDKTGAHKIALFDENGNLAAWTKVMIAAPPAPAPAPTPAPAPAPGSGNTGDNGKKKAADPKGQLAETGSSVAVVAAVAAVSLMAAVGVSLARRRQR